MVTPGGEVTRPADYLHGFLAAIDPTKWVDLVVLGERTKEEGKGSGPAIAAEIADTFNALMPLYRASIGLGQD